MINQAAIIVKILASGAVVNCVGGGDCSTGLPQSTASGDQLRSLLQIVFAVLGALSVLIIVIGGLRYTLAQDNPQSAAKARNTIIYAVAGLLVCIAAEAIVSFVLQGLSN